MHRRTRDDLLPLDTKLEKTLKNLKKEKAVAEALSVVEQGEANQNLPVATKRPQHRQRTMKDFLRPVNKEEYSTVRQPPIEVNNFELKPALWYSKTSSLGTPVKIQMSTWADS